MDQLQTHELDSLIATLGAYALRRSRWLGLNPGAGGALPGGETVESIVSLAFEKLLSGERKWDRRSCPSLEDFMKGVIRSELDHLRERTRRLVPLTEDDIHVAPGTPHELLLENERQTREQAALDELVRQCQGDPVATQMIHLMLDGCEPREIAQRLGLLDKVVYNTAKRIRRMCAGIGEQLREQNL